MSEQTKQHNPENHTLLAGKVVVINVGLDMFREGLEAQEAAVAHVQWKPPAGGDEESLNILKGLL